MTTKLDFPLSEIRATCEALIKGGAFILQKWTCGKCGRRITGNNVNALCENGHCQHCEHVTDLTETGCNFALIQPSRPMTVPEMEQALGLTPAGIQ